MRQRLLDIGVHFTIVNRIAIATFNEFAAKQLAKVEDKGVMSYPNASDGERKTRCLAGKNACPPEDCGGPYGYANLLAILADPAHEEHEEMREWAGNDIDPQAFDAKQTDRLLSLVKV